MTELDERHLADWQTRDRAMATDVIAERIERNWGAEEWRKPTLHPDDAEVFSECGRICYNIDYRSHWFVLIQSRGLFTLIVKHGGGEERINMPRVNFKVTAQAMIHLSSDDRYVMLHSLYDIHKQAKRDAETETAQEYRKAFVDGKLRKRKLPARGVVKVWIEA